MITTKELDDLRADLAETLIGTCNVQRATSTATHADYGLTGQSWATISTGAACRVDPYNRMDSDGMIGEREALTNLYRLTMRWDADLVEGDRIVYSNSTYEIVQLHQAHDGRAVRRAIIAKIQGA